MFKTTTSTALDPRMLASPAAFEKTVRERLHRSPPDTTRVAAGHRPSDYDLNPGHEGDFVQNAADRQAAVLVPVIARRELHVLLTQRTGHLSKHAGQIAFPGGTVDATDSGPQMTAIREAGEEVGLLAPLIAPLGFLDCYRTGTGFIITPLVAMIDPGFQPTLNTGEVESCFEVPLAFLMDPGNHAIDRRTIKGRERQFYAIPHEGRYIWGATAGIIRNLYERLNGTCSAS